MKLIVSCEHGGHEVPAPHAGRFVGAEELLRSHRGWDPGALTLASEMALAFDAPLFASTTTRLLVDLNRSIGHAQLYSEATRALPAAAKRELVAAHYRPHRDAVEHAVAGHIARGDCVLHIASHSFTPVLDGIERRADVAWLYDPRRAGERACAAAWLSALRALRPELALRRNYPYEGKSDGLTATLRRRHGPERYIGIELELNQRFVLAGGAVWPVLRAAVIASLKTVMTSLLTADPSWSRTSAAR